MAKQTFTTGQVLTAAQMTSLQQTAMGGGSATAKTASYVLVAADAGSTVIMNSASTTTVTVNTSLFAAGDTVYIQNIGAGVSTITAGTATVNTSASLALAQWEGGTLYFTSTSAAIFLKGAGAVAASNGPAFRVTGSGSQSITASTATKIQFTTETFDTDNCYDNATNYRFTPTKSGYYQMTLIVRSTYGGGSAYYEIYIYKNGANDAILVSNPAQASGNVNGGSILVSMNGSSDYLEAYAYSAGTSPIIDRNNSYFTGVWIRS